MLRVFLVLVKEAFRIAECQIHFLLRLCSLLQRVEQIVRRRGDLSLHLLQNGREDTDLPELLFPVFFRGVHIAQIPCILFSYFASFW